MTGERTYHEPGDHSLRYLSLIFAVTATSIMGNTLIAPVLPNILDDFGRPRSQTGLLIASTTLPGIVVAPVAGFLADRWGRREVLVPCLALFGVFGLAASMAPSFGVLLAFRFGMGLGSAALINLAIVLIGDRFDGAQRTRWIGINAGVLTLGLALFPFAAGVLETFGGWRWAIAPYGLALPTALFAWTTLPRSRQRAATAIGPQIRDAGAVLSQPLLLANFVAASLAFAIIFGVFLGAVPNLLDTEFGLSAFWRGTVTAVPAFSSALTAFNLQRLHARLTRINVLLFSALAWIVAFALMGLSPWLPLFLFGNIIYGLGEGGQIPWRSLDGRLGGGR